MDGSSGIPVVVLGLGEIGQAIVRAAVETPELQVVGVVDPAHAGRPLGQLMEGPVPALEIARDPERAFKLARGGVVLHAVSSSFEQVLPEIERAVRAGLPVVSTCEELAYPWLHYEAAAERLDELCESKDVAVVGVGVNPGFVLDRLPAFLSQVTGPVRHLRARRVQDVLRRREALRRKIGLGLSEDDFLAAADRGEIGHIGLSESAMLAALGCGFELDEVEEELVPLLAEEALDAAGLQVGQVAGVHQTVRGFVEGAERVCLELILSAGAEEPVDEVTLDAQPPVHLSVKGGLPGDEATAWAVVHAAVAIPMLHGLVSVLDLPAGR